jgi:hypothetical protein
MENKNLEQNMKQSINFYSAFETLLLSSRNQMILQRAFVQICHLFQQRVPKHYKLLIMNKSLHLLQKLTMQHQHRMNKFSWTNIQILNELIKGLETNKNYWLKFALAKEKEAFSSETKKNNIKIKDLSGKIEKIKSSPKTFPKFISDLYEY